jgi:hypothetical protein
VTPRQYLDAVRRAQDEHNRRVREYNRRVDQHNQAVVRDINRYNQAVDAHNRDVARAIDRQNQALRQQAENRQRAVQQYNREVDRYNAQVRSERQRIASALARVQYQPIAPQFTVLRSSAVSLNQYFESLDQEDFTRVVENDRPLVTEYPARENANSLEVIRLSPASKTSGEPPNLQHPSRSTPRSQANFNGFRLTWTSGGMARFLL